MLQLCVFLTLTLWQHGFWQQQNNRTAAQQHIEIQPMPSSCAEKWSTRRLLRPSGCASLLGLTLPCQREPAPAHSQQAQTPWACSWCQTTNGSSSTLMWTASTPKVLPAAVSHNKHTCAHPKAPRSPAVHLRAVEECRNPSLRDTPLAVTQKYLVVTANYAARAAGVTK